MATVIDYKMVLADLIRRRDELDRLIEAIEEYLSPVRQRVAREWAAAGVEIEGETKRCTACTIVKPWGDFYLQKNNRPKSECKRCSIARSQKWQRERAKNGLRLVS